MRVLELDRQIGRIVARDFHADADLALAWRASSPRADEFTLLADTLRAAWDSQSRLPWRREGTEF